MKKFAARGVLVAALLVAAAPAHAVDGFAVEGGGGEGSSMGRIAVQWNWGKRWVQRGDWHVGGYWDLGLGYWSRDTLPGQNGDLVEIGLTPVFRLQRNDLQGPYVEGAIGFHLLSQTSLGDKRFSTSFQFGDHLGFGYRFGTKSALDLGYRFQHLSNASIIKQNDGINFHQLGL